MLFLLAAAPVLAEPLKGVKGGDDRVMVAADEYPWSAVGRLNNGQGGHCSGVLVGPRLVVTAAHCLWNKKTRQPMPPPALTFVAGYDRGQYLAASPVERIVPAPDWIFGVAYGPEPASRDWALAVLARPVGDEVGWVALGEAPAPGARVVTVGYGQDKAHVPTAHLGCAVTGALPTGVLTHDCDAVHGDSGAPVLVWRNGTPRLVAIHVATFTLGDGRVLGGAVPVTRFAAEAAKQGAVPAAQPGPLAKPLDALVKARAEAR